MKKLLVVLVVLLGIGGIGLLLAANQGYFGYSVGNTNGLKARLNQTLGSAGAINVSVSTIEEHNICKKVGSTNDTNIFIPTKTTGERSTFISNKPSDVTLSKCGCYKDSDCGPNEICDGSIGTNSYCKGTFTESTTRYSCRVKTTVLDPTPACYKNGQQIVASNITECEQAGGSVGFYFNNKFNVCESDFGATERSQLSCSYPCSPLNSSECSSNSSICERKSNTTTQTYNCNETYSTSTSSCVGKIVPTSNQSCHNSLDPISPSVFATDYWDCIGNGGYWAFVFKGQYYDASIACERDVWDGGEVTCRYPCRAFTQSQCNQNSDKCDWKTNTTTVTPGDCSSRPGCTRTAGTLPTLGTCNTITQTCGTANGGSYTSLNGSSANLCNIGSASNFTALTSSWTWKCGTASCSATKTEIPTGPCGDLEYRTGLICDGIPSTCIKNIYLDEGCCCPPREHIPFP